MTNRTSRHPRRTTASTQAPRAGMTLIEVMMAMVILAVAMLSIAVYMTKFAQSISSSDVKAMANEIAADQIETVKGAPRYTAIDSTPYVGTVAMTGGYAGYTRTTAVTHTGGKPSDFYDYKTVTVTVDNPRLVAPVKKTDIIAAY